MTDTIVPPAAAKPELRYLLDPFKLWLEAEGIPVHEEFCVDLHTLPVGPWPRLGANGAAVNLKGRGDYVAMFLYELPPGAKSRPQQHLYEEVIVVVSGHGTTTVETADGKKHSFEWGPNSLFAIPLNARYQLFNGSGREIARLVSTHDLPVTMNTFHQEAFIFDNPARFPEREGAGDTEWYAGEGKFVPARRNRFLWETSFVPDVSTFALKPMDARGQGSSSIQFILADGVIHTHSSEMPVGTYKKAHRHSPDYHVYVVTGHGYSLCWNEGEQDFRRYDWAHGSVFAPTDMLFHQHFNTANVPARYFATAMGSSRYPFVAEKRQQKLGVDVSVKEGGFQIEYEDQDPRIHRIFLDELAKAGIRCKMGEFLDEAMLLGQGRK